MITRITKLVATAATSLTIGSVAFAPAPPPAWPGATPLPETTGTVQRFTLTPIGELEALFWRTAPRFI
jgi:hypothetical protein